MKARGMCAHFPPITQMNQIPINERFCDALNHVFSNKHKTLLIQIIFGLKEQVSLKRTFKKVEFWLVIRDVVLA